MARGEWVQPEGQRPSTAPASGRLLGKTPRGSGPPALQIDLSWSDNPSATNSPAAQKRTPSSTPARNPIIEGIDSPVSGHQDLPSFLSDRRKACTECQLVGLSTLYFWSQGSHDHQNTSLQRKQAGQL